MISFAGCGDMQQIFLILLMFAVSLLQLFLAIEDAADRRYVRFLMDGFLLFAELFYCGILLSVRISGESAAFLVFPVLFFWILESALLVYAAVGYIRIWRKMKKNLSRKSIKEGSDNLPDGICFFDGNGTVRLINRKMLAVGIMLLGSEIQTLDELHTALRNPPADVERLDEAISLYRFPDGTIRRFTEQTITDRGGSTVTEVIAADVTLLYTKQVELNRENVRLSEANRRMKWLLDNMGEIVREEEILSMKMRIHDDIGHSILSARKALMHQDIARIRENAALWKTAVDLLDRANSAVPFPDEWETVKERSRMLEVEIEFEGELPEQKILRHLLILAIRECVTNCVRHAGGSKVFVALSSGEKEIACEITNNGKTPEHPVTEGGGLSGLRRCIEREGGVMRLESSPRFAVTIILPRRGAL